MNDAIAAARKRFYYWVYTADVCGYSLESIWAVDKAEAERIARDRCAGTRDRFKDMSDWDWDAVEIDGAQVLRRDLRAVETEMIGEKP